MTNVGAYKQRMADMNDEQHVREKCANCHFDVSGPLREVRALFREHVESVHPDLLSALNKRRLPRKVVPLRRESEFALLRRLDQIRTAA